MEQNLAHSTPRLFTHDDRVSALVIAHPGHELRVHTWLERARPRVFVLTDGSGHAAHPRVESTAEILDRVGASRGSVFGRFSDRDAYQLILDQDLGRLQGLVEELSRHLVEAGADTVVSDAVEGFNPVHDLCFVIAEAAAGRASRRLDRPIRHFDFLLEAAPDASVGQTGESVRFDLDDSAWRRKMDAAWAYEMLRPEVERAIAAHSSSAFRVEVLREVVCRDLEALVSDPPYYESYGEERVAAGAYDRVLRFREHFLPLAEKLLAWAARG